MRSLIIAALALSIAACGKDAGDRVNWNPTPPWSPVVGQQVFSRYGHGCDAISGSSLPMYVRAVTADTVTVWLYSNVEHTVPIYCVGRDRY